MSDAPNPADVRMDPDAHRFVLDLDGARAFIDFRETPHGDLAMTHTEVPDALEGHGVGTALVRGALSIVRERGGRVLPFCPFVHAYIARHHDDLELVSDRYQWKDHLTR